jgi:uncharacterized protein YaaQ
LAIRQFAQCRFRSGILGRVKLIVAIIQKDDAGRVVDELLRREYRTTRLDSSGGFLRKTSTTLLIGVEVAQVEEVISAIRAAAKPRTEVALKRSADQAEGRVELRAAIVFVLDLEGFIRI